jgi:hypothetical protein
MKMAWQHLDKGQFKYALDQSFAASESSDPAELADVAAFAAVAQGRSTGRDRERADLLAEHVAEKLPAEAEAPPPSGTGEL